MVNDHDNAAKNGTPAVLILGATGGIGSALARQLRALGVGVAVGGRTKDRVESLGRELGAHPVLVDATDFASVEAAAVEAREALGELSGMVNCVGSVFLKPAHLTKPEEWQEVIAANLTSAFAVVRAAGTALRQKGGSVVLIASGAARVGLPNHEAIAAAKAGVIGLTRSAAATYAKAGIRFNAVAPGLVRTPATARITERPGALSASVALHPLGRIGEAPEVASVIRWLLEPSQSWITGQVIGVDGGLADLKVG